jgi:hypothetical protein
MLRPWLRRKLLPERTSRAALASLAAAAYLASIVGYPAAAPRGMKAGGEAFPCQNHRCGCTSAEQCWKHCCCFTRSERLAWAVRRGVKPPREVVVEIRLKPGDKHDRVAVSHRACCAKPSSKTKPEIDWTVALRARGCRGLGMDWVVFNSPIAPPPPKVAWRPAEDAVAFSQVVCDSAPEISYAPPTPPA